MRLEQIRRLFRVTDPALLFRRYFVNTLFDATFVVLGILAASAFVPEANVEVATGAILAACLAIGISSGVSVYEAERTEAGIRLHRLERAMLSPLDDTDVGRRLRATGLTTALVNFLAPLLVASLTIAPILLFEAGVIADFAVAAWISSGIGVAIIFGTGLYLGSLAGGRPWSKAVRMTIVAILTFGALVLLERLV